MRCLAFFAGDRLGDIFEDLGLVVQVDRDGLQGRFMFTGVMGAKQQFAARGQDRAKVCASTASVASISGRKRNCCQYWCHRHTLLISCLVSLIDPFLAGLMGRLLLLCNH